MSLVFGKYPNISSIDEYGKKKSSHHKVNKRIKKLKKKVKHLEEQLDKESTQEDAGKKRFQVFREKRLLRQALPPVLSYL